MPALPSGHIVTADEYVGNGFYNDASAGCTVALTLTGSLQDVAGCTKTFTMVNANGHAVCMATFDSVNTVTASNNVALGSLVVDGTPRTDGEAHWDDRLSRITAKADWVVPLGAGSHTIKLQAKLVTAGTMQLQTIHTKLVVMVFDLP